MSRKVEDGVTECGTNSPKHVTISFGQCKLCPTWRGIQHLVNGVCFEHRVWGQPRTRTGTTKKHAACL